MTDREVTDALRAALRERAGQVRPAPDALHRIRGRVRGERRRRRGLAIGFTALATAAAAVVGVGTLSALTAAAPSLQRQLAPPVGVSQSVAPPAGTLPVYVVGSVGGRDVLYREYRPVRPEDHGLADNVQAALIDMIAGRPLDPDYHSAWPVGAAIRSVATAGDTVTVDLAAGTVTPADPAIAVQQLVHTATAVAAQLGHPQLVRVRLLVGGAAVPRLWGVDVSGPVTRASSVDVLAPVWLSSPQEGAVLGRTVEVQVVGSVPGGAVALVVWDARGVEVVRRTVNLGVDAPARGEAHLSVSLAPGVYRIEAYVVADDGTAAAPDDHVVTVR